jgi:hypothetical protein
MCTARQRCLVFATAEFHETLTDRYYKTIGIDGVSKEPRLPGDGRGLKNRC